MLTDKTWLKTAISIHGHKYDYSNTCYDTKKIRQGSRDAYSPGLESVREFHEENLLRLRCPEHGLFKVGEMEHIGVDTLTNCNKHRPFGCPVCDQNNVNEEYLKNGAGKVLCKVQNFYTGSENYVVNFKTPGLPDGVEFISSFDVAGSHKRVKLSDFYIRNVPLFVELLPEPKNIFDKFALAVVGYDITEKSYKIGYVPSEYAKLIQEEKILDRVFVALGSAKIKCKEKIWISLAIYGDKHIIKIFHRAKLAERIIYLENGQFGTKGARLNYSRSKMKNSPNKPASPPPNCGGRPARRRSLARAAVDVRASNPRTIRKMDEQDR